MRLGLYTNPIGRLREAGSSGEPEPAVIATLAVSAGAQVILGGWARTGGLLTDRDLRLRRELIHADLMIVVSLGAEAVEPVVKYRPQGVVMVGTGWDGARDMKTVQMEVDAEEITAAAAAYRAAGVPALALVEPDPAAIKSAARCGLAGVVLDTAGYAAAFNDEDAEQALDRLANAALAANKFGLLPAAAHGLNYQNAGPVAGLPFVEEIYVGRAIAARAMMTGIQQAVAEMLAVMNRPPLHG